MTSTNNFQEILNSLKTDLVKIDKIIKKSTNKKAGLIFEITDYIISSGGKRIRPILLIIAAKLCSYQGKEGHYNLAASIELIHTATLLHDDVVDNSHLRRAQKTANAIWDNKAAILVGDYLFSAAFELMTRQENIEILKLLSQTSAIIANGEVLQLMNSTNIDISYQKYLEIIDGKTAALFSAATAVGALLTHKTQLETESLKAFGKNLGIIFQITDDFLDYFADKNNLGKDLGDDFFEGKVTLPIIIAYERADKSDKEIIRELFKQNLIENNKNYNNFSQIITLLKKYNTASEIISLGNHYYNLCHENLKVFSDSKEKEQLLAIVQYCLDRINLN